MQKRKAVKLLRRVMHILAQAKQASASFLLLKSALLSRLLFDYDSGNAAR